MGNCNFDPKWLSDCWLKIACCGGNKFDGAKLPQSALNGGVSIPLTLHMIIGAQEGFIRATECSKWPNFATF